MKFKTVVLFTAVVIGITITGIACNLKKKPAQAGPPAPPPVQVGYSFVQKMPLTELQDYVGQVAAWEKVTVPVRVSGILEKICFKDGEFVKKGQLLFEIEDEEYKANVAAAEATVKQTKAEMDYAQTHYNRQASLAEKNAAAQSAKDDATRLKEFTRAKYAEALAKLQTAQIALGYTKICSEINGRAGKTLFSAGNYLTPSSGSLVTIVSSNPVKVTFSISERDLLSLFGGPMGLKDRADLKVYLPDGTLCKGKSTFMMVDNEVDSATGSVKIWFIVQNDDQKLVPGGFVSVTLSEKNPRMLPVVPLSAVMTDQKGNYVYVLQKGNIAKRVDVTLGPLSGERQFIEQGLEEGDRIVVSGTHKIFPNSLVEAYPEKETK